MSPEIHGPLASRRRREYCVHDFLPHPRQLCAVLARAPDPQPAALRGQPTQDEACGASEGRCGGGPGEDGRKLKMALVVYSPSFDVQKQHFLVVLLFCFAFVDFASLPAKKKMIQR